MSDHWSDSACAALAAWARREAGLVLDESRRVDAEDRMRRLAARLGLPGPEGLLAALPEAAEVREALLGELTVGETYFFREPPAFAAIRAIILPELRARASGPLRVWSAGCASGEEAYSLAILLEEEGFGGASEVIATDLSRAALGRARAGAYRPWSLRGQTVPGPWLQQVAGGFRVVEAIRRRVRFHPLNLTGDAEAYAACGVARIDLALCRNVLIYLAPEHLSAIAARLYESLAPGGWLLLGASDPNLAEHAPFELVRTGEVVLHRRPLAPESQPRVAPANVVAPEPRVAPEPPPPAPALAPAPRAPELEPSTHVTRGLLLLEASRHQEAAEAFRRALFLDRHRAIAHYGLGLAQLAGGEPRSARRALENAKACAERHPPEVPVEDGEEETMGRVAQAAEALLASLVEDEVKG